MASTTEDSSQRSRLIVLHGFTQTHHHMHRLAHDVAARIGGATIVAPDLPGHGLSSEDRLSFDEIAAALPELCGTGVWIGYSMGARLALAVAAGRRPEVERLVLIGGTAGIADEAERTDRVEADEVLARRLEQVGAARFVDEWLAQPMFANVARDAADREHRLRNSADGLASSLRLAGTGAQRPQWAKLADVDVPLLVVVGEHDAKFTALGERIAASAAHASLVVIPGAGHAAHLEQAAVTADAIAAWLKDTWPAAGQPSAMPTPSASP